MTSFLQLFGWRDLLDVALVAVIIYRLIIRLKGTVAVRLLQALATLFLASFVSRFLHLSTLNWLFDHFLGAIVLIMVIIFQHDIRRSLLTIGRRQTGDVHEREEGSTVINELVTAIVSLAEKRIGALIVFEREMGISNLVEIGTEVDAKVTSEIITSIFLPYSPIHDGAVIIQKGKLTKAGCFLPLTQDPEVSRSLGTRHRAAIGISELADVLVLVVSEETGGISMVMGGRLTRGLDATSLRKQLKKHLDPQWLD